MAIYGKEQINVESLENEGKYQSKEWNPNEKCPVKVVDLFALSRDFQ